MSISQDDPICPFICLGAVAVVEAVFRYPSIPVVHRASRCAPKSDHLNSGTVESYCYRYAIKIVGIL